MRRVLLMCSVVIIGLAPTVSSKADGINQRNSNESNSYLGDLSSPCPFKSAAALTDRTNPNGTNAENGNDFGSEKITR